MAKKTTKKTPASRPAPSSAKRVGTSPMDMGMLAELVELMTRADLSEVDLRDGEKRVALRRGVMASAAPVGYAPPPQAAASQSTLAAAAGGAASPTTADDDASLVPIKSPMVGTFYGSPTPDAPAFVSVGKRVGPDTDVCIIEAMKVFNNIKAETTGTISRVVAENGKPVEYGQVMFLVKPD